MKGKLYEKNLIIFCLLIISGMVNAQYQVTQEQAVTAAINTTRYNGRSNITSSNVEKINTNIVGNFTKVIVVKSNAKNNPKSI